MPNATAPSRDRFVRELLARARLARRRRIPLALGLFTTVHRNLRRGLNARALPTDGLAADLVAHGQGGEAYRHLRFHAACRLLGFPGNLASLAADQLDRRQAATGRAEALAELAGNAAGRTAGDILVALAKGSLTEAEARSRLRTALSDP